MGSENSFGEPLVAVRCLRKTIYGGFGDVGYVPKSLVGVWVEKGHVELLGAVSKVEVVEPVEAVSSEVEVPVEDVVANKKKKPRKPKKTYKDLNKETEQEVSVVLGESDGGTNNEER